MAYRLVLRSKGGVLRRSLTVVTLDRYETGRALRTMSMEETLHVGDQIVVEDIPRD